MSTNKIEHIQTQLASALAHHPVSEIGKGRSSRSAKQVREINRLRQQADKSRPAGKGVLKATKRDLCTQGGHYSNRFNGSQVTGKIRLADLELDEMGSA